MKFQIDIKKVIKLLAKDIYDSPYALLRENLQNAYDAVLMRKQADPSYTDERIEITIEAGKVVIVDNGIGMTEATVENNYWKAGSSGKNTEEARRAGVVGTFGIGAMANFGVCNNLEVRSRYYESEQTIVTSADLESISLTEECINTSKLNDASLPIGTKVTAFLQAGYHMQENDALTYLNPFIQYLPIPVYFNGRLVSQHRYKDSVMINDVNSILCEKEVSSRGITCHLTMKMLRHTNGLVSVFISNIYRNGIHLPGEIALRQDMGTLYGYRNGFGLASIPVASNFRWGGAANLNTLVPTAGRDSLTRESIDLISVLIASVEESLIPIMAGYDSCDLNRAFLQYLYSHTDIIQSCAGLVRILRKPTEDRIPLNSVSAQMNGRQVMYYDGHDASIINQFANEQTYLLILGNDTLRRTIFSTYLTVKGIPSIPDKVTIIKKYNFADLDTSENSIIFRIESILEHDYFINKVKVIFAEISHGQPSKVEKESNTVVLYIDRHGRGMDYLRDVYKSEYGLFDGFVKDYVRQHIYSKIAEYCPSSTREGAEALKRIMLQKRDLFSIEEDEIGGVDDVIKDYLSGKATLAEVHRASAQAINSQRQKLVSKEVGSVESILPNVSKETPVEALPHNAEYAALSALPPVNARNIDTKLKLLTTDVEYPALNGHKMFLALSNRLYERYSDFFFEPHTTKVIWSTHKIVYVFTHASNQVSMYYDIDLETVLPNEMTGGRPIVTTTILTEGKIFVPIIPEMYNFFDIAQHQGKMEFYVRFDTLN